MKSPRLGLLGIWTAALIAGCATGSPGAGTTPGVPSPTGKAANGGAATEQSSDGPTAELGISSPGPTPASTVSTSVPPGEPIFTVAAISDASTETVTREQAQAMVNEAGQHLKALVPVIMVMTDFVEDGAGGSTTDMLQRYMISRGATLPNGVVIFSRGDNDQARLKGAYGYAAPAPAGFRNSFMSPIAGFNQIYVAVVDYGYRYMECGYGSSDSVKSNTALTGECNNHPGTDCVQQNGYSMCSSAVGQLYMSTPTYFAASAIVHELLQPFAPNGAQDDYSTAECTARMGYPAGFHDLQESQYHNELCPFVYDNFLKSYQP